MSEPERALPTYKDFIAKYGKRPADIVFAVTQLDTVQLKDAEIVQAVKAERERLISEIEANAGEETLFLLEDLKFWQSLKEE